MAGAVALCHLGPISAKPTTARVSSATAKIAPQVLIISMVRQWPIPIPRVHVDSPLTRRQFEPEAQVWHERLPSSGLGDLLAQNISTPGLSMLYPHVHCVANGTVCQVTTGEGEINAAATLMALGLSDKFDLTKTYFLMAGIAGVNPKHATLGGVALAHYAVQVALQYEFDAREMPEGFETGYFGYGTRGPGEYPLVAYGTEVFKVNEELRDRVYTYAQRAALQDSEGAAAYRAKYKGVRGGGSDDVYAAGAGRPAVVKCDTATSDAYYSGTLLSEAFENITLSWTNGTGKYCMTAQEDNASLEVLVRLAIEGLVDFARVIVMRTGRFMPCQRAQPTGLRKEKKS